MEEKRTFQFGAFDPLAPGGLMTVAEGEHLFAFRLITRDDETGSLSYGRLLDSTGLRIGPMDGERLYTVRWQHAGKEASLAWGRTADDTVYGEVAMEPGLSVMLELYVPREYRLSQSWVNFTRQGERCLAGEMISPYPMAGNNALRLLLSREPDSCEGYNERAEQIDHFSKHGAVAHLASGDIWNDMGLCAFSGAVFRAPFAFLCTLGAPEAFLPLPSPQQTDEMLAEGRKSLEEAGQRYQTQKMRGQGPLAGIPDAMGPPICFNTLYREDTGHRFIIVDRPWARSEDAWGITFNWDTFLSSVVACWFDEELALENIRCGFDMQLPDGRIPLHARRPQGHRAEPPIIAGRAQHIVQGLTVWETYLWIRDKAWLRECYPKVRAAHNFWLSDRGDGQAWRDALGKGLVGFGYDPALEMGILGQRLQPYVGKAQYAYFETYDDSPQWTDGVYFKTVKGLSGVSEEEVTDRAKYLERQHTVNLYTLERCCLYARDAECLALMAVELGLEEDAKRYHQEWQDMGRRINDLMWDEQDGCYYNLRFDGTLSKVQTPDCFMPMLAGIAPPDRVERLMPLMLDETKFWGRYKMPSVARDDPAYPDQKYWRGQIWPPQVFWTHLGLRRAGKREASWALAESSGGMLRREWEENGFYPENYNGDTGRCSGSPHYNWGTLMGLLSLRELVDLTPDTVTFGDTHAPQGTGLSGIRLDGHVYDVRLQDGWVIVAQDGREIARQRGPVTLARGKERGK